MCHNGLYEYMCHNGVYEYMCHNGVYEYMCHNGLYEYMCHNGLYEYMCTYESNSEEERAEGLLGGRGIAVCACITFLLEFPHCLGRVASLFRSLGSSILCLLRASVPVLALAYSLN
jgi:hypothetical protein